MWGFVLCASLSLKGNLLWNIDKAPRSFLSRYRSLPVAVARKLKSSLLSLTEAIPRLFSLTPQLGTPAWLSVRTQHFV